MPELDNKNVFADLASVSGFNCCLKELSMCRQDENNSVHVKSWQLSKETEITASPS